jgi:hypothetical protein
MAARTSTEDFMVIYEEMRTSSVRPSTERLAEVLCLMERINPFVDVTDVDVLVFGADLACGAVRRAALVPLDAHMAARVCGAWYHALFSSVDPTDMLWYDYEWINEQAVEHNLCTDLQTLITEADASITIAVITKVMLIQYERLRIFHLDNALHEAAKSPLPRPAVYSPAPTHTLPTGAFQCACSKLYQRYKGMEHGVYMLQICLYYFVAAWMHQSNGGNTTLSDGRTLVRPCSNVI